VEHFDCGFANGSSVVQAAAYAPASGSRADGVWNLSFVFPAGSASGTWSLYYCAVADNSANYLWLEPAQLVAAGYPTTVTLKAAVVPDVTAPVLSAFVFTSLTTDLDASSAPVTVTASARLTDAGSGVEHFDCGFANGSSVVQAAAYAPASGSRADGVWNLSFVFPVGSASGTWSLYYCAVADNSANYLWMDAAQLVAAGYPTAVTLKVADVTPPTLQSFQLLAPYSISTLVGPDTVTAKLHITDDSSGVASASCVLGAPDTSTRLMSGLISSGTSLDGTWTLRFEIPQGSPIGTWSVQSCSSQDVRGNSTTLVNAQLPSTGTPTTLVVTAVDVNAPVFVSFGFTSPTVVSTVYGGTRVVFQVRVTDDEMGVRGVSCSVTNPDYVNAYGSVFYPFAGFPYLRTMGATLVSGTALDGVWEMFFDLPQASPRGVWTVRSCSTVDNANSYGESRAASFVPGDAGFVSSFTME
ncbi:MAG: hypothetical protein NTX77_04275, partial [Actinobacteria bacterium]|nr:hypothetical protein [Actinomycetota bacterium]